ncbi:hypothetical protein [Colwellia sp. MEBiC06753]
MKTLFAAALTIAVSFTANANVNNVKFRALDQSAETQICIAAAQGGIDAAKTAANELGLNFNTVKRHTVCNNQPISQFAAKFLTETAVEASVKPTIVKFVAADNAPASQICKEAVVNGLSSVKGLRGNINDIYCNGEIISRFVRKNKA